MMSIEKKIIAVVDDDPDIRRIVNVYLSINDDYNIVMLDSGEALVQYLERVRVDLILLDIEMKGMSGIQTYDIVKGMAHTNNIPIIFLTGKDDKSTVLKCVGRGADGYIVKPVDRRTLQKKVEDILIKYEENKSDKIILMVDDDPNFLKVAKLKLSKFYNILTVTSGKTALDYLAEHNVDLIILDYFMPLFDGKNVLAILKKNEKTKDIPVVMLSSLARDEILAACSKTKPDGAVTKSAGLEDLVDIIRKHLKE